MQTIRWEAGKKTLVLIDQTRLPGKLVYMRCKTVEQVWQAIRALKVRGAPAIGAAAAFGMVLGIGQRKYAAYSCFKKKVDGLVRYLASARPTAVNLFWALERMKQVVLEHRTHPVPEIGERLLQEALAIMEEDRKSCRKMADIGQVFVKDNDSILTYCNAGILATVDYGTALGVIYRAKELKKKIKVYSCETRPLLQGARLTCWELRRNKIDVTLLCDNMAGYLMKQKKVDKIFIGADRISANGDVANKIGSYALAILAKYHRIPFYVVAPVSTFDTALASGADIPIEERDAREVGSLWYKRPMAPAGINVYNPAFDIVPGRLITAIVTDKGILTPAYLKKVRRLFSR
ncbi:MAG: S-methyl-5-thioribose-1-phosphate isomerase [Candidatus Omnitrophica bacterium]|nr:S-methyl-5-thioribose-1-phosphate isomerase [Candidatus Omnitrophota bacterium]MCG2703243.1 S-methyl-5-thioribose-1-phosphate isomerase [Candidatus Omnitrophota bacterium]